MPARSLALGCQIVDQSCQNPGEAARPAPPGAVSARAGRRRGAFGCYGGPATKLSAENDDARADEFCAPTENSTEFEIFDNNRETKSIV